MTSTFSDFWSMGGYAFYVWSSYLVIAALLLGLVVTSLRQLKGLRKRLLMLETLDNDQES